MTETVSQEPDVVIIGCGMAGISSAFHLIKNNFVGNIVILEARDRIGGRIVGQKTDFEQLRIEWGANWIHGIMGNPVYEIALRHKLIQPFDRDLAGKRLVGGVTFDGKLIEFKVIKEVCQAYFYFIKKCETYYQQNNTEATFAWDNSVGKHLRSDIDAWISKTKDPVTRDLRQSVFNSMLNRETCISGCHSMDDVSLSDFGSYVELPGGNVTIPSGYTNILFGLLKEINAALEQQEPPAKTKLSILKSHKVTSVKWKGIGSTTNKQLAEIVCDNGAVFLCKHVIVTLPLGVLKRDALKLFQPQLPQYKLNSIDVLGFGVVDKVFMQYRNPITNYLDPQVKEVLTLWNANERGKWYHKIYSIARISEHCLLGWVSGLEALEFEKLSNDEIIDQVTEVLKKFFNRPDFPRADSAIITRWGSDPFTCGSYTYLTRNARVKDVEMLSQPIYTDPAQDKPVLAFAGEATHPSFYSTVHGAFLSGKKAAYYLLDVEPSDNGNKLKTTSSDSVTKTTSIHLNSKI